MTKKATLLLGAVASVFLAAQARAAITGSNGATCVPATSSDAGQLKLELRKDGVWNADNSASHSLSCGLVRLSSSSPRMLFIDYDDGANDRSVSCFVAVQSFTGTPLWSQTQNSDRAGVGKNAFQFTLPSSAVGHVFAYCTLPMPGIGGESGINGYNLQ